MSTFNKGFYQFFDDENRNEASQGGSTPVHIDYTAEGGAVSSGSATVAPSITLGTGRAVTTGGVVLWTTVPSGGSVTTGIPTKAITLNPLGGGVTTGTPIKAMSIGAQGATTTSGAATLGEVRNATGGATTSGGASLGEVRNASGGAVTSGTPTKAYTLAAAGGATTSGSARLAVTYNALGGATSSGRAALGVGLVAQGGAATTGTPGKSIGIGAQGGASTTGHPGLAMTLRATGGVTAGGSAMIHIVYDPEGGIIAGGSASWERDFVFNPTGGTYPDGGATWSMAFEQNPQHPPYPGGGASVVPIARPRKKVALHGLPGRGLESISVKPKTPKEHLLDLLTERTGLIEKLRKRIVRLEKLLAERNAEVNESEIDKELMELELRTARAFTKELTSEALEAQAKLAETQAALEVAQAKNEVLEAQLEQTIPEPVSPLDSKFPLLVGGATILLGTYAIPGKHPFLRLAGYSAGGYLIIRALLKRR